MTDLCRLKNYTLSRFIKNYLQLIDGRENYVFSYR